AAEIVDRQLWWLFAAVVSAGGIAAIVFGRQWWLIGAGIVLLILPHVVGAPEPPSHDVTYPGALAGEFVVAALVVSATLWAIAGAASGWLYQRLTTRASSASRRSVSSFSAGSAPARAVTRRTWSRRADL